MAKRIISTGFWEDEKVIDNFSPEDKYFMLYLLTNPKTTTIGIYKLPKKIAAFELGYTRDTVSVLLDRFQNKYNMIVYLEEEQEIAVLNSLKYTISKGGKPIEDMVNRELKAVKNAQSLQSVYDHLSIWWDYSDRVIDGIIKEMFEDELSKRKEAKEKNASASASASANAYTDSVDDSYRDSSEQHSDKPNESVLSERFDSLWKQYPNKKGKPKAFTAYKKAIKEGTTDDEILKGIENYKQEIELKRIDKQYIAHGSTWFNQKRWADEYDLTSNGNGYKSNEKWDYRKELYGE